MEFLQILDTELEPGGLAEWIPAAPGGLGAWARDDRGTSHNHEQHLRAAHDHRVRTGQQGGRESWLGVLVEFDEQIDLDAVRTALLGWIDRHEVLRSHVSLNAARETTERYTSGPGSIHLRMRRIGWYSDPHLLIEQIAGSFDRATAPLHWPAYRFATVARSGSFTLLFAADHSLVDGYSLINTPHELRELYRAARDRRPPQLPPVGSYLDFSGTERLAADAADARHTAVAVWSEFLAGRSSLPRFALLPQPGPRDHPPSCQPAHTLGLLGAAATEALDARARELGGSLIGAVLTVAALVYRAQSIRGGAPADRFATLMPRHTRTHAEFHAALGWFVSLAPVGIDVSDDPDFPTALERMMVSLDRAREGASLPLLRLGQLLGFVPQPKFVVSFMDTRGVPGAANEDSGGARVLRSHTYDDDEVYLWVNRTPSGLRLHLRYPADEPGWSRSPIIGAFLADFTSLLARIAAGG